MINERKRSNADHVTLLLQLPLLYYIPRVSAIKVVL